MAKNYEDATLQMIWDMVHKDRMKRREIAEFLNIRPETVEEIYAAAERKYGKRNAPSKKAFIEMKPVTAFVRQKGEYSNHSPMRIASSGREN